MQKADALDLMFSLWALDETPSIVELCLYCYVRLGYLPLVLEAEYLEDRVRTTTNWFNGRSCT